MALIKFIDHASGAQSHYWRVTSISLDELAKAEQAQRPGVAMVHVAGYVSEAARRAGKPPLDGRRFAFVDDSLALLLAAQPGAPYETLKAVAYALLATTEDFKGAASDHEPAPLKITEE